MKKGMNVFFDSEKANFVWGKDKADQIFDIWIKDIPDKEKSKIKK